MLLQPLDAINIQTAIDSLEDEAEGSCRSKTYDTVYRCLNSGQNLSTLQVEKLITAALNDLVENNCYDLVTHIADVLSLVFKNKVEICTEKLVKLAYFFINYIASLCEAKLLSVTHCNVLNVVLTFPDEVLTTVVSKHEKRILDFLLLGWSQNIQVQIQITNILQRLLKILPPDIRKMFVKNGQGIWFTNFVPLLMTMCSKITLLSDELDTEELEKNNTELFTIIEVMVATLEMLTIDIVENDYANDLQWMQVLECLYNPVKYPLILKNLVTNQNIPVVWHRIWIVFIKLLKSQITSKKNNCGSPINSLLPVVEIAFKGDVKNRCCAFSCWNSIIDNFCKETNPSHVDKRIKLLIIPILLNNAKVEEVALEKHNTWWYMIKRFESLPNKIINTVIIPFLHFCFGKHFVRPDKDVLVPGLMTSSMKQKCLQTFVEIIGHEKNCTGCVEVPQLTTRLLTSKFLVDYWDDWTHSLKISIIIAAELYSTETEKQITCIWSSFLNVIASLPPNNIRKDLFQALLIQLQELNKKTENLVITVLKLIGLAYKNAYSLFLNKSDEDPFKIVLKILNDVHIKETLQRLPFNNSIGQLKEITNELVKHNSLESIDLLLAEMINTNESVLYWTSIVESIISEGKPHTSQVIERLLLSPTKFKKCSDPQAVALIWISFYAQFYDNVNRQKIYNVIKALSTKQDFKPIDNYLHLCSIFVYSQYSHFEESDLQEIQLIVERIQAYKDICRLMPVLIKILNISFHKLTTGEDLIVTSIFCIIKHVLNLIVNHLKSDINDENVYSHLMEILIIIKNIYKEREFLLEKHYVAIKEQVLDLTEIITQPSDCKCALFDVIQVLSSKLTSCPKLQGVVKNMSKQLPESFRYTNKSVKKTNIVKTIVENGEEFVVVQSNWKFNPKKLTDNQKEKLKRKREDIPALYQDLSQSQDELKLMSWKTDSQDSTISSSKSNSLTKLENNSVSLLKNVPNASIIPNIMDNINLTTQDLSIIKTHEQNNSPSLPETNSKKNRMALKDRVFKNVRNLMEKSISVTDESNSTPKIKTLDIPALVNSAPAKMMAERPSRVKKTPKKFQDSQLILLTKKQGPINNRSQDSRDNESLSICNLEKGCEYNSDIVMESPKVCITLLDSTEEMPKQENKIVEDERCTNEELTENCKTNDNVVTENFTCVQPETRTDNKFCETAYSFDNKDQQQAGTITDDFNEHNLNSAQEDLDVTNNLILNIENTPNVKTPENACKKVNERKHSSLKKAKKSRIEKELAIDMVEGHPFLSTPTEKRMTRKCVINSVGSGKKPNTKKLREKRTYVRRKINTEGHPLDSVTRRKIKDFNNVQNVHTTFNLKELDTKSKVINKKQQKENIDRCKINTSTVIKDSQEQTDMSMSEDFIESSQDSTLSSISIKCTKNNMNKIPIVSINKIKIDSTHEYKSTNRIDNENSFQRDHSVNHSKEDISLPRNEIVAEEKLTEDMDTEPVEDNKSSEVIVIADDVDIFVIDSEEVGQETLEIANADTQSMDPAMLEENLIEKLCTNDNTNVVNINIDVISEDQSNAFPAVMVDIESDTLCSPFKDDLNRKKEFLDNTLEISPIKTLSPVKEKKTPSPEKKSDYVVIKLTSPVESNGEPFEKNNSPEIFSEDKISPEKRNMSPPRTENIVNNSSPSSLLSLKRNKSQVRPIGRGAQMLGLCVLDRLPTNTTNDKLVLDEAKKSNTAPPLARRNLKMTYNSLDDNSIEQSDDNVEDETFLMLKRSIPTSNTSPAGPILKRKIGEIIDDTTISPVAKRKRVSFHDPPVSTTISVQKYIEPSGVRSPQNSALKKLERQIRSHINMKSPRRLDHAFKLDTILTKTVESFMGENALTNENIEMSSLEQTPDAVVVNTSDLNDEDPIFPALVGCTDSIDNIACDLSSTSMKDLFLKEFEDKIKTVGDLAKMTELEVNRLCIKAPKLTVAREVLTNYLSKCNIDKNDIAISNKIIEPEVIDVNILPQINSDTNYSEVQTIDMEVPFKMTQTDEPVMMHATVQTDESDTKCTKEIIKTCLLQNSDFIEELEKQLDVTAKTNIASNLPFERCNELLMKKLTLSNSPLVIDAVLECPNTLGQSNGLSGEEEFLIKYLSNRYDMKRALIFCNKLMKKILDDS